MSCNIRPPTSAAKEADRTLFFYTQSEEVSPHDASQRVGFAQPAPYPLARVGHVIAPTLRQVAALGYETYNAYLSLLSLHAEQLFAASGLPDPGGANAFHTLIGNQELRALLCAAFSFFLVEDAVFSQAHSALLCMAEGIRWASSMKRIMKTYAIVSFSAIM